MGHRPSSEREDLLGKARLILVLNAQAGESPDQMVDRTLTSVFTSPDYSLQVRAASREVLLLADAARNRQSPRREQVEALELCTRATRHKGGDLPEVVRENVELAYWLAYSEDGLLDALARIAAHSENTNSGPSQEQSGAPPLAHAGEGRDVLVFSGPGVLARVLEEVPLLPYPVPMQNMCVDPEGAQFDWRLIHYVFHLPDPSRIAPHPEATNSRMQTVRDFFRVACELARSRFWDEDAWIQFRDTEAGDLDVQSRLPDSDVVRGMIAPFRLLYRHTEPSSFAKVHALLRTQAFQGSDAAADRRLSAIDEWGKAHKQLRKFRLKHLAEAKLFNQEPASYGMNDFDQPRPERTIDTFINGHLLHRDEDKRRTIDAWDSDRYQGPIQRMRFFEAVSGLSHFYMGYAVLALNFCGISDLIDEE